MDCPKCDYSSSKQGVKIHYGRSHEGTISGVMVECAECGKEVRKHEYRLERSENLFCSESCRGDYASKNPFHEGDGKKQVVKCDYCDSSFEDWNCRIERQEKHFCDKNCFYDYCSETDWNEGENHPMYNGGVVDEFGKNWHKKRKQRLKLDDYECVICKISNKKHYKEKGYGLDVHHIKPRRAFEDIEKSNKIENLISLCRSCHKKVEQYPVRIDFKSR